METDLAVQIINRDLHLGMMGVHVQASRVVDARSFRGGYEPDLVRLVARWDNVDTSHMNAQTGYQDVGRFTRDRVFSAKDLETRDDVLRKVVVFLVDIYTHEIREGVRDRVRDDFSPFHPHRPDGRKAWGHEDRDLAFDYGYDPDDSDATYRWGGW